MIIGILFPFIVVQFIKNYNRITCFFSCHGWKMTGRHLTNFFLWRSIDDCRGNKKRCCGLKKQLALKKQNKRVKGSLVAIEISNLFLGLESAHYSNHVLTADGAFGHLLATSCACTHMPTFQHDTVNRIIHTYFAQFRIIHRFLVCNEKQKNQFWPKKLGR